MCRFPARPAIQALLGGVTQLAVAALPPAHPYIESGALKALAITGAHRWFDLKDVPTMIELGYKDFIADTFQAFSGAGQNTARDRRAAVGAIGRSAESALISVEQLLNNGFEVIANGPDGLRRRIAIEVPKWRDIIARSGIKPV
jgi:tripartite-type tricarboxylate transporter receptor subunit TctC